MPTFSISVLIDDMRPDKCHTPAMTATITVNMIDIVGISTSLPPLQSDRATGDSNHLHESNTRVNRKRTGIPLQVFPYPDME